jgi:hypothetical protein
MPDLTGFCKALEHVTIGNVEGVIYRIRDYFVAIDLSRGRQSKVPTS